MALPHWLLDRGYRGLLRPVLFRANNGDPETTHEQTLALLEWVSAHPAAQAGLRLLAGSAGEPTTVAGIRFANRVGLAAGMDKDARALRAWPALGFGHVELGTVTAQAQPGNPRPRMYRLPDSGGIINRMGFNNSGAEAIAQRLEQVGAERGVGCRIGISVGKSRVTALSDAVADYVSSFDQLARFADYLAINVSSPNTPGLRKLQDGGFLTELAGELVWRAPQLPIFVKVAPDLSLAAIEELLQVAWEAKIAGIIATNTTITRPPVAPKDRLTANQTGGLSGRPLTSLALATIRHICNHTTLPVIAAGGIMSADDAARALDAGARLVQLYSGFIYAGPALVGRINALERS